MLGDVQVHLEFALDFFFLQIISLPKDANLFQIISIKVFLSCFVILLWTYECTYVKESWCFLFVEFSIKSRTSIQCKPDHTWKTLRNFVIIINENSIFRDKISSRLSWNNHAANKLANAWKNLNSKTEWVKSTIAVSDWVVAHNIYYSHRSKVKLYPYT